MSFHKGRYWRKPFIHGYYKNEVGRGQETKILHTYSIDGLSAEADTDIRILQVPIVTFAIYCRGTVNSRL